MFCHVYGRNGRSSDQCHTRLAIRRLLAVLLDVVVDDLVIGSAAHHPWVARHVLDLAEAERAQSGAGAHRVVPRCVCQVVMATQSPVRSFGTTMLPELIEAPSHLAL